MDSSVKVVIVSSLTTVLMWGLNELSSWLKNRKTKRLNKEEYDILSDAERESVFQDVFHEISENYPDAMIICAWGFHNGVKFLNGRHDIKMSMVSEWCALGVESGMIKMQNIRWKTFKRFIAPLREKSVYVCHETDPTGINPNTGEPIFDDIALFHQSHNMDTIVTAKIEKDDLTVGLLVMKFGKRMQFNELDLSDFVFQAKRIESIL